MEPVLLVGTGVALTGSLLTCLGLKLKRLRQGRSAVLTEEEYQDFIHGNATPSNSEHHCAIFNKPFHQQFHIPKTSLVFKNEELGKGQYGVVVKGELSAEAPQSTTSRTVAIKSVKLNSNESAEANAMHFKALILDLKIMAHVESHINVVAFLGACIENIMEGKVHAVFEYCANQDLHRHLRLQKQKLSLPTSDANALLPRDLTCSLLEWSRDISNGLAFVNSKNVIHGNLTAKNILLTSEKTVKICDFGLSRLLVDSPIFAKKPKASFPWKWMALESLKSLIFSPQSDVWAYGVVLFEVFSLGEIPYPDQEYNDGFIEEISAGTRPPKPNFANDEIYELMTKCWDKTPTKRPEISSIVSSFQDMFLKEKSLGGGPTGIANYIVLESNEQPHPTP